MRNKLQALLHNLTEQLNFIDLEINDNVMKCEKSIEIITTVIYKVKTLIFKSGFKSEQEKIFDSLLRNYYPLFYFFASRSVKAKYCGIVGIFEIYKNNHTLF